MLTAFSLPVPCWERSFIFIMAFSVFRDPAVNKKNRDAFRRLVEIAAAHGWGEYRTATSFYDDVMRAYSFNDHSLLHLHETIKDAVDPNGILSAGRYGIWPKHLRRGMTMKALLLGSCCAQLRRRRIRCRWRPRSRTARRCSSKWCLPCHGHGDQFPGTVALGVKYQGKLPGALQDRSDLAPDFVKAVVRTGVSVMPFFRKTEVSDADLDALAAYLAEPKKK